MDTRSNLYQQTKRFCSRYDNACLTFSTASLLRKLCNCYTGFCFNKESPEIKSNHLSPQKIPDSEQRAGGGEVCPVPPPPSPMRDYATSCKTGTYNRDVFVCDEATAIFIVDTKYSSFSWFFFSYIVFAFK